MVKTENLAGKHRITQQRENGESWLLYRVEMKHPVFRSSCSLTPPIRLFTTQFAGNKSCHCQHSAEAPSTIEIVKDKQLETCLTKKPGESKPPIPVIGWSAGIK